MAILSDTFTPSEDTWIITLNRGIYPQEPQDLMATLNISDITFPSIPDVTIESIANFDRDPTDPNADTGIVTFKQELYQFTADQVVIQNHRRLNVVSVTNINDPVTPTLPSNMWSLTLNRPVKGGLPAERTLQQNAMYTDLDVSRVLTSTGVPVSSVSSPVGSGLERTITFTIPPAAQGQPPNLLQEVRPDQITISNHADMEVVAVRPEESILSTNPNIFLPPGSDLDHILGTIRNHVSPRLDETDVSDSVIYRSFLIPAEFEILELLGLTTAEYKAMAYDMNNMLTEFGRRANAALAYRAAARLTVSLPTIIRQATLQDLIQYESINLDDKVNYFISWSNREIQEILPVDERDTGFEGTSFVRTRSYF